MSVFKRLIPISTLVTLCSILAAEPQASNPLGNIPPLSYYRAGERLSIDSVQVHLALATAKVSKPPAIVEKTVLWTVAGPYHSVALVLRNEDFAKLRYFEKNAHGVFVYAWQIPPGPQSILAYLLVIDGVWTIDPANPSAFYDEESAQKVSWLQVPQVSNLYQESYKIVENDQRTAHFTFIAPPGSRVSIAGDFNNWDPFLYYLKESKAGVYELKLPLPQGIYHYCIVYNGRFIPDPLNPNQLRRSSDRQLVSVVEIKSRLLAELPGSSSPLSNN